MPCVRRRPALNDRSDLFLQTPVRRHGMVSSGWEPASPRVIATERSYGDAVQPVSSLSARCVSRRDMLKYAAACPAVLSLSSVAATLTAPTAGTPAVTR
jgi:hypothetical protein